MTQEELQEKIIHLVVDELGKAKVDADSQQVIGFNILQLINQHVKEVIGEDLNEWDEAHTKVNDEKAEQRKRAGL